MSDQGIQPAITAEYARLLAECERLRAALEQIMVVTGTSTEAWLISRIALNEADDE